jgi:hypothetical protein
MATTVVRGAQLKDGTVQRADLDVATVGQAVVAKLVQGTGITLSSTGGDSGTGDVTVARAALDGLPAAGTINQILRKRSSTDYDTEWDSFGSAQVGAPSNPPGVAGTTQKMLGLGTATYGPFLFTPTFAGKALVIFAFGIQNDTANASCVAALRYGTGTPPVNQAAVAGTAGPGYVRAGTWAANAIGSVTIPWFITGLAVGTQYWFDMSIASGAAGQTCSCSSVSLTAVEIP